MAWIETIAPENATDRLKVEYDKAMKRAGRVFGIVRLMSQNARTLKASMDLYKSIMHGPSELSRLHRELIATIVSKTNDCFY